MDHAFRGPQLMSCDQIQPLYKKKILSLPVWNKYRLQHPIVLPSTHTHTHTHRLKAYALDMYVIHNTEH